MYYLVQLLACGGPGGRTDQYTEPGTVFVAGESLRPGVLYAYRWEDGCPPVALRLTAGAGSVPLATERTWRVGSCWTWLRSVSALEPGIEYGVEMQYGPSRWKRQGTLRSGFVIDDDPPRGTPRVWALPDLDGPLLWGIQPSAKDVIAVFVWRGTKADWGATPSAIAPLEEGDGATSVEMLYEGEQLWIGQLDGAGNRSKITLVRPFPYTPAGVESLHVHTPY